MGQWLRPGIIQNLIHSWDWQFVLPATWGLSSSCSWNTHLCPLCLGFLPAWRLPSKDGPGDTPGGCRGSLLLYSIGQHSHKVLPRFKGRQHWPLPQWEKGQIIHRCNSSKMCLTHLIIPGFCHSCRHVAGLWFIPLNCAAGTLVQCGFATRCAEGASMIFLCALRSFFGCDCTSSYRHCSEHTLTCLSPITLCKGEYASTPTPCPGLEQNPESPRFKAGEESPNEVRWFSVLSQTQFSRDKNSKFSHFTHSYFLKLLPWILRDRS